MTIVKTTRINNFVCPACGEVIRQVIATDGVVKGWCHSAKKEIEVIIDAVKPEEQEKPEEKTEPISYLDQLKQRRERVLHEVVSAREDGDLKENSPYHAAREQLSIMDDKIRKEEERLRSQISEG